MRTEITREIIALERREVRRELINLFLEEEPGTGTGENCSHYKYYVDTIADGKRIFLKRPARLNKGFDFEVHIEDISFSADRRRTMPSHSDIYEDLEEKLAENPDEFERMHNIITRIYNAGVVTDDEIRCIHFESGHDAEIIIKAIKWLFIEQDITYWNWSGRNMLYSSLSELWEE